MKLIVTNQIVELDEQDLKYYLQGLSICTKPCGYKTVVFTSGPNKTRYLSRIIMNCPALLEVDHKDGNTLNNKRDNLRIVTSQQNKFNTVGRSNVLPKGVIKHGAGYKATITVNYRQIYLGTFRSLDKAIDVRQAAEQKYFGEYSLTNSRESK